MNRKITCNRWALACGLLLGLFSVATWAQPLLDGRISAIDLARLQALAPEQEAQIGLQRDGSESPRPARAEPESLWVVRRIEVYTPDARLVIAGPQGMQPAPRSPWRHYIGHRAGERIALSLAPDGRSGNGLWLDGETSWRLELRTSGKDLRLSGESTYAALPDGTRPVSDCLGGLESTAASQPVLTLDAVPELAVPKTATHQVTLALDTDNELLQVKFGNDTTAATNYLAQLVTQMSAIYEQEPGAGGGRVQLQIGHQILRPSTTADPYLSVTDGDIFAQLQEFGTYWQSNYSGVSRAFALMISGKLSVPNSAAGIAWLLTSGNYCTATNGNGGHYSINRVFKFQNAQASHDVSLVAHELGHNFGLAHTHCTNTAGSQPAATNTLDQCFAGESASGCYSGPTSCPGSGPGAPHGTLMSYCHLNSCGANVDLFHPAQVTVLSSRLASQSSSCLVPIAANNQPPTITAPASIGVTEDVASSLAGISFADPDAGSGNLTATFNVPRGVLTAISGGGVIAGGSATTRTLDGTLVVLNAYIAANNLRYTTAANDTANVNLTVTINDNGNTGAGGAQSANKTVTLTVAPVNDPPTISAPASQSIPASATVSVTGVQFADVDAGSGSLTVTLATPASITLSGANSGGVSASGSGNNRTFNGTLAALNAYVAAGNAKMTTSGFSGTGTLAITINDNGNTGSGGAQNAAAAVALQGVLFADGFE